MMVRADFLFQAEILSMSGNGKVFLQIWEGIDDSSTVLLTLIFTTLHNLVHNSVIHILQINPHQDRTSSYCNIQYNTNYIIRIQSAFKELALLQILVA